MESSKWTEFDVVGTPPRKHQCPLRRWRFWEVTMGRCGKCGKPKAKPYEEKSINGALRLNGAWNAWSGTWLHIEDTLTSTHSWSIFCFVVSSHRFTSFTADMNPNAGWSKNTSCDASGWFLDPPESTKNHTPSEWIMGGFGHFIKFAKLEETLNPWFPHWLQIVEHWNMGYRTFRDDNLRSPILGKPIWERANMGGIIDAMWGQATATF